MKVLALLASIVLASPAFATVYPALIETMTDEQSRQLQFDVAGQIIKQAGMVNLENMKLNWEGAKCLEAKSEMAPDQTFGVCTVSFFAFQINGEAAVLRTQDGFEAKILHLDVE